MPPYDTPVSIAYLLGSEASKIASMNNVSNVSDKIPINKLVIVPISCSCSGNIYLHLTPYIVENTSQQYFQIANETYQGLNTCQALVGQNYYDKDTNLTAGTELMVPVRCACPSANQTANGVKALLTYLVKWGDSVSRIAEKFQASLKSTLDANMLSWDSKIYPFTPTLVPVAFNNCEEQPSNSFCSCTNGNHSELNLEGIVCPRGHAKDSSKASILIGIFSGVALLCLCLLAYQMHQVLRKRRNQLRREKYFKQNGGFLLQEKLTANGSSKQATIFSAEELVKATDNFNQSRILGQGGFGTVYKGMLPDGRVVAIKRSKEIDQSWIEQFINEVVIFSQINHRNIVKLFSCCLETEVPLLVYEFIPNKTFYHHIHEKELESSLSWEDRFRIACEVSGAVTYMHSAASVPIFHRDIKSSNILLDDKYSAKISDFGTSRSVPFDKTHLTLTVQGTFGYMDPEYFQSSKFSEKSDVYSFGVMLIELLTRKQPLSFARDKGFNLIERFISLTKTNLLLEILDPRVIGEAGEEDIFSVAKLAVRCLRLNGKKRPTMKEVFTELEGLRRTRKCLQIDQEHQNWSEEMLLTRSVSETFQESIMDSIGFTQERGFVSI
ncbi:LysM receptor kinase [Trema orientale]|uniref:LysM receptor kinase n=1 Tax=Trema orientale TaxID=63057 RepID=A0A2P5FZ18_TREOI|nr:LysM receptor kinase [Trema orientale]